MEKTRMLRIEWNEIKKKRVPPARFELATSGLRDQRSTTELKGR